MSTRETLSVSGKTFTIVPANDGSEYEGLRALWSDVFGDEPEYVDAFYANFAGDIEGWAVTDEDGRVCSALTCYLCGEYAGRPAYVSYAICTREDMRGQGLAAMLTAFVRDRVTGAGGWSVISPAEPSLTAYYAGLGYEPHFTAAEMTAVSPDFDDEELEEFDEFDLDIGSADQAPLSVEADLQPLTAEEYGLMRASFLARRPHIEPSAAMLRLMASESMDGRGMYSVNRGDAICIAGGLTESPAVDTADPATGGRTIYTGVPATGGQARSRVWLTELIPNPVLQEFSQDIVGEIASMIAKHFGTAEAVFITPGPGAVQGMLAGPAPQTGDARPQDDDTEPYYGFPIP